MQKGNVVRKHSPFRRVVTGQNKFGRSEVLIDSAGINLGTLHELWVTDDGEKTSTGVIDDPLDRQFTISPRPGGTVFRYVEIEPASKTAHMTEAEQREAVRYAFSRVGSEDALVDTSRHPAMHKTKTLDYIIVLRGVVTMLLDEGEVELRPNDVVIQRATNHAWINNGDEPALLAAILISSE